MKTFRHGAIYHTDNELYHHGIKGQRWGVRRYRNPDGTLTNAGKKRQVRDLNRIYKTLDKQGKQYLMADDNPPKKFTNVKEYSKFSANSSIAYDKKKPVAAVTSWREGNEAALTVMTDPSYQRKGYAQKCVDDGMKYLGEHGIKRVYWDVNVNNNASISLATKNGFKYLENGSDNPLWDVYIRDL